MADSGFRSTHRTTTASLLAWSAPGPNRILVGQIAFGTELQVVERRDTWARVRRADGLDGWVESHALQPVAHTSHRGRWFAIVAAVVAVALVVGAVVLLNSHPTFTPNNVTPRFDSPSSASLLDDAYDAGRIDRPTWLRYRAYSLFGADALPSQYQSRTPNVGGDTTLAAELNLGDPLPSDVSSELMSYIGRPATQGSVFYGQGPVQQTAAQPSGGAQLAANLAVTCSGDNWTWMRGHSPYRVWTKCSGDYASRFAAVIAALDALWGPMTGLMGSPLPDEQGNDPNFYGGDGSTDIYLVPADNVIRRGGNPVHVAGLVGALTVPADIQGNRSSGYILLDERSAQDQNLQGHLANALFRLLEDARNYKGQFIRVRLHYEEAWFAEASAIWAVTHFARKDAAAAGIYTGGGLGFLKHQLPIDAHGEPGTTASIHTYESFLWPYFMEQEQDASVIARIWSDQAFAAAPDGDAATAVWDHIFPFANFLMDFAVRNLDDPTYAPVIDRRYQQLDPAFPTVSQDDIPAIPTRTAKFSLDPQNPDDPPATMVPITVEHLTANYYNVTFHPNVDQVVWNLGAMPQNAHLQARLIVLPIAASPVPRAVNLPLTDPSATLCDVKQIERAILIVTNADLTSAANGTITAKGTTQSCTPSNNGFTFTAIAPNHAVADGNVASFKVTGIGFMSLAPTGITFTGTSVLDPMNNPFTIQATDQSIETIKVVSDTEIDLQFAVATEVVPGPYDVFISGAAVANNTEVTAACKGCLIVDPKPGPT